MRLTGAGMVAGVVGWPIGHSLSPFIHNSWLQAAGLDGVYIPLEVTEDGFDRLIEGLRHSSFRGVNVTAPFKERAYRFNQGHLSGAGLFQASNLLLFDERGRVRTENTDGEGLLVALRTQSPDLDLRDAPVVILGAGGAARTAAMTLAMEDRVQLRIANRTPAKAEALAERVRNVAGEATVYALGDDSVFRDAVLIVNATSANLQGSRFEVDWSKAPPSATVMDLNYKPLVTPFLAEARRHGHRIVDGLAMLIGQARPSFEALFGQPPPEDVDIRELCLRALGAAP